MNIAVVGSREFKSKEIFLSVMTGVKYEFRGEFVTIISGGADGPDTWAYDWAKEHGLNTEIIPAEWKKYGKPAGMIRNTKIVNRADLIIAFWDGSSHGTNDTIEKTKTQKKDLRIIWYR